MNANLSSGMYKIINKINGKYYVGSSNNMKLGFHYLTLTALRLISVT